MVDEDALTAALSEKKLYGAVLDVFESEPLSQDSPLWDMENVVITPHNSFVSEKNSERLFSVIYGNLSGFLKGGTRQSEVSYWFRRKSRTAYNFRGDLIKRIISCGYEVIVTGPNRVGVEKNRGSRCTLRRDTYE